MGKRQRRRQRAIGLRKLPNESKEAFARVDRLERMTEMAQKRYRKLLNRLAKT